MVDRVSEFIIRYGMLRPGDRVGVAVSGGKDSVCLLDILHRLTPVHRFTLHVVHLNHLLRGEESDADATFVLRLAADLGIPCHIETIDVRTLDQNLEQAGRQARLGLFRKLMAERVVDRVATGHTRSDQAETVLHRLLRGTGITGLAGILPVTEEGLIRPLLELHRADIDRYAEERRLEWREDSSNRSSEFLRNRIRHRLLPELERDYQEGAGGLLASLAGIARDEEDWWSEHIERIALGLFSKQRDGSLLLPVGEIRQLHVAEQRRLLRWAFAELRGTTRNLEAKHVELGLRLVHASEGSGRVQIPDLDLFRSFDWVRLAKQQTEGRERRNYKFPVSMDEAVALPGNLGCILLSREPALSQEGYTVNEYWIDGRGLTGPLECRNWFPGDALEGSGGPKRVKLWFQEAHVPLWERHTWPVLTCDEQIVWVKQFGAAAQLRATGAGPDAVCLSEILPN